MYDQLIISAFATALRGLRIKADKTRGDDPDRFERWRDRYLMRLREARTLETARAALCELLAEGGVMAGGIAEIAGEERAMAFWKLLNADWQRVRDLALFAIGQRGEEE